MKRILDTTIYRDNPMRIDMLLPSIFCTASLLLCGLYPLAMSALPTPRTAQVQEDELDPDRVEPAAIETVEAKSVVQAPS